jgi:methyltransferase (TIGR00027 family)
VPDVKGLITGQTLEETALMAQRKASSTMIGVAVLRAMHQVLDAEPKILDDPLAVGLVEGSSREEILAASPDSRPPAWFRSIFVLRSRYTEDCLAEAAANGISQYVLLGAGMDTFAYRQPDWAANLRIFEIDHPESQKVKREHLLGRGIEVPPNVEFVPIDFERVSLADGLAASSLDPRVPAFFSWLGVTQYLTREAIDSTLRFILSMPRGSELVTEFILPPGSWTREEAEFLTRIVQMVAELGEPWLTYFTPAEISGHLLQLGFSRISHLTPEDAAVRYFLNRRDQLRPPHHLGLLRAEV